MRARSILFASAAILPIAVAGTTASAQSTALAAPPEARVVDDHGVNLSTGQVSIPSPTVSIGGANGLTHTGLRVENGWRHNYLISVATEAGYPNLPGYRVQIGGESVRFLEHSGGYFIARDGMRTGKLERIAGGFKYTTLEGVEYTLEEGPVAQGQSYYGAVEAIGTKIEEPDGTTTTLDYKGGSYQISNPYYTITIYTVRLQSVRKNTGFQLKFQYESNTPSSTDWSDSWYQISKVTTINNTAEYCDPLADSCSLTNTWPSLSYSSAQSGADTLTTVTDVLGRSTRFREDANDRLVGLKRPSDSSDSYTVSYDSNDRVASISYIDGYVRNYNWNSSAGPYWLTSTTTDALGRTEITKVHSWGLVYEHTDALGNFTERNYDPRGQLIEVIYPEGNRVVLTRDIASRITEVRRISKPTSSLPDIVTSATYPALTYNAQTYAHECSNYVLCNKPLTTTDERGSVTNYVWSATYGVPLTITGPADNNGQRQRTRYSYANRTARYYVGPTTLANGTPIYSERYVRRCRTAMECIGSANEQLTETNYTSGGPAHNLLPSYVEERAGNGTLASRTSFTYDILGNVESVDGPIAGSSDTVEYRYDSAGQLAGTISADPDGSGGKPRIAERLTYDAEGRILTSETGTVANATALPWDSAFAASTKTVRSYDNRGRLETAAQIAPSGTTQYSVTQFGYDSAGRLECTARRMNAPSTTTSLPTDACVPMAAGGFGEDRISRNFYNVGDQLTERRVGLTTSEEQRESRYTYSANGQVILNEDAAGNLTEYVLDGFDRRSKVIYPSKTVPGVTNASDFELATYDSASNIVAWRTRNGDTISYVYDNLGRVVEKGIPGRGDLTPTQTRDVFFAYDLFNNLTIARFGGLSGPGSSFSYDGKGRLLSESTNISGATRTTSFAYDAADRMSQLTYPDGQPFTYHYDALGRPESVRQGATNLVTYLYGSDGNLQAVNRQGSAPNDAIALDSAKRIQSITTNPVGTSNDVILSYTYNPAGQIVSEIVSNQNFVTGVQPDTTVDYDANGLNQYESVKTVTYTYDASGNLVADGIDAYKYDIENRLVEKSGSSSGYVEYDPLGRAYLVSSPTTGSRILSYAGSDLIGEYSPTEILLNRYVHGAGTNDDPLVWYPGTSIAASNANHLYSDILGSIVLSAKNDGSITGVRAYDEFGVPTIGSGTNVGAFGYTGQQWFPEIGMNYFKARMYSPTLGRFVQNDPIGYADGSNMYRYVDNDPVNDSDPSGLYSYSSCLTWTEYTPPTDPGGVAPDGGIIANGGRYTDHIFCPQQYGYGDYPLDNPYANRRYGLLEYFLGPIFEKAEQRRREAQERNRKRGRCMIESGRKNGVALAMDAAGIGLVAVTAKFQVAGSIAQSALAVGGMGLAIQQKDGASFITATIGKGTANASGVGLNSAMIRRLGAAGVAASTLNNLRKSVNDYNACMSR